MGAREQRALAEGETNRQTNGDWEQEREGGKGPPQVGVREPIIAQGQGALSLSLGGQGHSLRFFPPSLSEVTRAPQRPTDRRSRRTHRRSKEASDPTHLQGDANLVCELPETLTLVYVDRFQNFILCKAHLRRTQAGPGKTV